MKEKFLKYLAFLLLLNIPVKLFYVLIIDVAVQNAAGSFSYGYYFPILNLCLIFQVILDFGLNNFIRREVARENTLISKYFISIFITKIFLSIIYFFVILTFASFFGYKFKSYNFIFLIIVNQIIAELILFVRSNLGALYQFKQEGIISVLDRVLMIIFCGALLLNPVIKKNFKIEWFIYCQTISYTLTLIFAILILFKRHARFSFNLNFSEYISIIKKTIPYAILFLLMGIHYRIDPLLIKKLALNGQFQAGIYAHSFRLLDMLQNYSYLFSILLLPMFSRMLKEKSKIDDLVNISFLLLIIPSIIICSFSLFNNLHIISFLYKEDIIFSSKIFAVLITGFIFISTSYVFGTLLTANGNFKTLIFIASIGVLMNVGLNYVLIPHFGALGAAFTALFVQAVTSILQFIVAVKKLKIKINYFYIRKLILFMFFSYLFAFLVNKLFFNLIISSFIFLIGVIFMLLFLKILNKENLKILYNYFRK